MTNQTSPTEPDPEKVATSARGLIHPWIEDARSVGGKPAWVGQNRLIGGEKQARVRFKQDAYLAIREANPGTHLDAILARWKFERTAYASWANEEMLSELITYLAGGKSPWFRRITVIFDAQLAALRSR